MTMLLWLDCRCRLAMSSADSSACAGTPVLVLLPLDATRWRSRARIVATLRTHSAPPVVRAARSAHTSDMALRAPPSAFVLGAISAVDLSACSLKMYTGLVTFRLRTKETTRRGSHDGAGRSTVSELGRPRTLANSAIFFSSVKPVSGRLLLARLTGSYVFTSNCRRSATDFPLRTTLMTNVRTGKMQRATTAAATWPSFEISGDSEKACGPAKRSVAAMHACTPRRAHRAASVSPSSTSNGAGAKRLWTSTSDVGTGRPLITRRCSSAKAYMRPHASRGGTM
mmetsp:Transcript_97/g.345  ORF Transcript_97/g.345 Transcript_97/m.345 type:complete len:283 (-) Transcript_97:705-1553(-)